MAICRLILIPPFAYGRAAMPAIFENGMMLVHSGIGKLNAQNTIEPATIFQW